MKMIHVKSIIFLFKKELYLYYMLMYGIIFQDSDKKKFVKFILYVLLA